MAREDETEGERLDRNWVEILQELRVTQTGTQILLAFLLTIPFQGRFEQLEQSDRIIYLVLVATAALATVTALTPVALHRALFRRGAKPELVATANVFMRLTLLAVAVTLSGAVLLVFDVVVGTVAGIVAGSVAAVLTTIGWAILPRLLRGPRL